MQAASVSVMFERVALASEHKVAIRSLKDGTCTTYGSLLHSAYHIAEDLDWNLPNWLEFLLAGLQRL